MKRPPVLVSLQHYRSAWLRDDLVAGLTVWAVLVPEGLAYAAIAGLSPVVGLYAAVPALALYALFGSSRHLVTGPMAATAALSAAAIGGLAAGGTERFASFSAGLALVIGVLAVVAALLRLGFLASFISEPVLKGFIIGLALTIIVGQLPKLFGVEKASGDFFEQLGGLVSHLKDTEGWALLIGAASLALLVVLRRLVPAVPGPLVVVVLGVAAVKLFDLDAHGVAIVGHISSGLPSLGLPHGLRLGDYGRLVGPAAAIMLVGFVEGLGAAKSYAARDQYEIEANRELLGLGAANLGAGLSAGMVVNGSLSKTAVNGAAGARTQASGLAVAALTLVTLLFLTGLFADLPEATLAAIVIAAVVELIDVQTMVNLYRVYTGPLGRIYGIAARADFIAASSALLGVVVLDTLPGLFLGITISILLLIYRASRSHVAVLGTSAGNGAWVDVARHPDARTRQGIVVVRPEGGLFYANADAVRRAIITLVNASIRAVVVDAQSIPFVDVTAAEMLTRLERELASRGVQLLIARYIGQVRDVLEHAAGAELEACMHATVREAVASIPGAATGDDLGADGPVQAESP